MPDHFEVIYSSKAEQYDRMVSYEDYEGNLLAALQNIRPVSGIDVVEFGAGTGRVTKLLAPLVKSIRAFDESAHMIEKGRLNLQSMPHTNWTLAQAPNHNLPIDDGIADLAIEGWSFGQATGWFPDDWQLHVNRFVEEMYRVLKPGGTAVVIETLGTGQETPSPPNERLAAMYDFLKSQHGFEETWIRTDYKFESVKQADELTRFFFGDELADRIVREKLTIVPECTGIWWKYV